MGELISARGIHKYFPGVHALDDVTFNVGAGEIHALVGENGAGKSTLVKILSGIHTPDSGEILFEGRRVDWKGPRDALKAGIAVIHQELSLAPHLSVAENIFLGREPRKGPFLDRAALRLSLIHISPGGPRPRPRKKVRLPSPGPPPPGRTGPPRCPPKGLSP